MLAMLALVPYSDSLFRCATLPGQPMKLWTVQTPQLLEDLEGPQPVFVDESRFQGEAPEAYEWLRCHVRAVLPDYGGHHFLWFYGKKPSLRRQRRLFARGVEQALIEVELPGSRAFSMPSWAWHLVYCGDYLALTAAEFADWTDAVTEAVPDEDEWPLPWYGMCTMFLDCFE